VTLHRIYENDMKTLRNLTGVALALATVSLNNQAAAQKSVVIDDTADTPTITFGNGFNPTSKNTDGERLTFSVTWTAAADVKGTGGFNYVARFVEMAGGKGVGDWLAVSWPDAKKGAPITLKGIWQSDGDGGFALDSVPKDVDPIIENGANQDITKVWRVTGQGVNYKATAINLPDGVTISAASDVNEQQNPVDLIIDPAHEIVAPDTVPEVSSTAVLSGVCFLGLVVLRRWNALPL
jgi:hypothetical protein